jgi:hypothetical protein
MFNAKQTKLLNSLGCNSLDQQVEMYEAYCEVACEMAANGMNAGTFADYLQRKVEFKSFMEQRKAQKQKA